MVFRYLSAPPVTVPSGVGLAVAARTLAGCEGRQLPVMRDGRPIGVLAAEDLADQGMLRGEEWLAWGRAETAGDLVRRVPILEEPTVEAALTALLENNAILVCDRDGVLVGLLTEHDGVRIALDRLVDDTEALAHASAPVRTIDFEDRACNALQQMRWHKTRHVVLTRESRAVGVLSRRDLVAEGIHRGRSMSAGGVWRARPLIACGMDCTLRHAVEHLADARIGLLPLVDGEGRAGAVLTRRDAIRVALGGRPERRAGA